MEKETIGLVVKSATMEEKCTQMEAVVAHAMRMVQRSHFQSQNQLLQRIQSASQKEHAIKVTWIRPEEKETSGLVVRNASMEETCTQMEAAAAARQPEQ